MVWFGCRWVRATSTTNDNKLFVQIAQNNVRLHVIMALYFEFRMTLHCIFRYLKKMAQ